MHPARAWALPALALVAWLGASAAPSHAATGVHVLCPIDADPCVIDKARTIGADSLLDFEGREVRLLAPLTFESDGLDSRTTIRARRLEIGKPGRLRYVDTALNRQLELVIEVEEDLELAADPGKVIIQLTGCGGNALVATAAAGDIHGTGRIAISPPFFPSRCRPRPGGLISLSAPAGAIRLSSLLDATGGSLGDGGQIELDGLSLLVGTVNAHGGEQGGALRLTARAGEIRANGVLDASGSGRGPGGEVDVAATPGPIHLTRVNVSGNGAGRVHLRTEAGAAAEAGSAAAGSGPGGAISLVGINGIGKGDGGLGAEVVIESAGPVTVRDDMDLHGSAAAAAGDGGSLRIAAVGSGSAVEEFSPVHLEGRVDVGGRGDAGRGGSIDIEGSTVRTIKKLIFEGTGAGGALEMKAEASLRIEGALVGPSGPPRDPTDTDPGSTVVLEAKEGLNLLADVALGAVGRDQLPGALIATSGGRLRIGGDISLGGRREGPPPPAALEPPAPPCERIPRAAAITLVGCDIELEEDARITGEGKHASLCMETQGRAFLGGPVTVAFDSTDTPVPGDGTPGDPLPPAVVVYHSASDELAWRFVRWNDEVDPPPVTRSHEVAVCSKALLDATACGDAENNRDGDSKVDFPTDLGCFAKLDPSEEGARDCRFCDGIARIGMKMELSSKSAGIRVSQPSSLEIMLGDDEFTAFDASQTRLEGRYVERAQGSPRLKLLLNRASRSLLEQQVLQLLERAGIDPVTVIGDLGLEGKLRLAIDRRRDSATLKGRLRLKGDPRIAGDKVGDAVLRLIGAGRYLRERTPSEPESGGDPAGDLR